MPFRLDMDTPSATAIRAKTLIAVIAIVATIGLIATACGSPTTPQAGSSGTPAPLGTMALSETPVTGSQVVTPPPSSLTPEFTPAPSPIPLDDFTDGKVSMRAWVAMVVTSRSYFVYSTQFSYKGVSRGVGNQEVEMECSEATISLHDQEQLWRALYSNDILELKDNEEMRLALPDASSYHTAVELGGHSMNSPFLRPGGWMGALRCHCESYRRPGQQAPPCPDQRSLC